MGFENAVKVLLLAVLFVAFFPVLYTSGRFFNVETKAKSKVEKSYSFKTWTLVSGGVTALVMLYTMYKLVSSYSMDKSFGYGK